MPRHQGFFLNSLSSSPQLGSPTPCFRQKTKCGPSRRERGSRERAPWGAGSTGASVSPDLRLGVSSVEMEMLPPPASSKSKELGTYRRKGPGAWQSRRWSRNSQTRQLYLPGSPNQGVKITPWKGGALLSSPPEASRPGGIQLWLTLGGVGRGSSP